MPKPLVVRKQPWSNNHRGDIIRADPLNPNIAVESRYYMGMQRLILQMTNETEDQIRHLFHSETAKEFFAEDASMASQARIITNALIKKFEDLFSDKAPTMADEFIAASDVSANVGVQSSIQKLTGGLTLPMKSIQAGGQLNDILKASVTENVALIKSIPSKYFLEIQGAVMRSITTGNGLQDLVPALAKYKQITLRRARGIAMDQTRKAYENLSTAKLENAGISEGEWIHTGGSNHPRKTHVAMNGKIFKLSEGLYDSEVKKNVMPGELPYCRCRKRAIIRLSNA